VRLRGEAAPRGNARQRASYAMGTAIKVSGLPPNTDFDLFVIQVPNAKFGMSWYMGDIQTNSHGQGHGTFIGRFSVETFVVAPGSVPAWRWASRRSIRPTSPPARIGPLRQVK
jgi:hypothetical protein